METSKAKRLGRTGVFGEDFRASFFALASLRDFFGGADALCPLGRGGGVIEGGDGGGGAEAGSGGGIERVPAGIERILGDSIVIDGI